ncbi:50S ribosomal protein L25/general stress protein Ctc [Nesterenkonia haasae]|uniref:50S ribosomal protein L25/general stress protein Ctc n=1 Tax=Nesterenkonia haasae TaxID=2587813 RepID=UPI00139196EE|nr:50S ribosomal protein L25/general stress protein Ctc [Nesterenkonia haasae]NDK30958.1 50S ribosomal protein L25/general stress protein Ctc [Nesterenkonia haasae]
MADKILISAEVRTEFGKGAARRARRADQIPAVIYGHGDDPRHVVLPGHQTALAVRNPNALITLDIEGDEQMVVPKDIQRDPIKPFIVHMDLLAVRKGEKIVVDVPVEVLGEPAEGFEFMLDQPTVPVEADALNLPDSVSIDITDRDENALPDSLVLPADAELALTDLESPIVSIYEPQEQPLEDEDAEAAEGEDGAEGEEAQSGEAEGDDSE